MRHIIVIIMIGFPGRHSVQENTYNNKKKTKIKVALDNQNIFNNESKFNISEVDGREKNSLVKIIYDT